MKYNRGSFIQVIVSEERDISAQWVLFGGVDYTESWRMRVIALGSCFTLADFCRMSVDYATVKANVVTYGFVLQRFDFLQRSSAIDKYNSSLTA